ncbi:MAG: surface-adhesin E family protein [Thermodesulfobacteriota bacterium]
MKSLSAKLGVILIGLLVSSYTEVWGQDWMYYGGTDKSSCFYDAKSISRPSENIVEVSEKEEYTNKGVNFVVEGLGNKYENLSHLITLWQINCADKKFRFLSVTYYSKEKTVISSWRVLYSSQIAEEWSPFITHSVGERLYKAVCR